MSASLINLIVQIIAGALGGNAAGSSMKNLDLTRRVSSVELKGALAERLKGGIDLFGKLIDVAAVAVAADSLGGIERALEMAVDYSKVREQFGKPIGSFQALKHAAAEIVADVEPARAMLWYAAYALDTGAADASRTAAMRCVRSAATTSPAIPAWVNCGGTEKESTTSPSAWLALHTAAPMATTMAAPIATSTICMAPRI